jgi:YfiH family protein
VFQLDEIGVLRAEPLTAEHWLEHGFGTRLSESWPQGGEVVSLKQIHSDIAWEAREGTGCIGEGDALITSQPGLLLTIRTADCIPVLIADPVRRAVAAIHAGWRGTAAGIAGKTVKKMATSFSTEPADLIAVIGPGIGACCFEVGPDVAAQFGSGATHVDLVEANRLDLVSAGVSRIMIGAPCTVCQPALFHSFRRDKTQGRMVSAIGLRVK